jgi:endoglucanase Y|uniref:UBA2-like domain protein n=1 Tax=Podoviridae sp. cttxo15 TaxID=2826584 RepID=A0A8S5N1L9_9CAUD|nr:MAG TPA: UBA2-like domain protein [Podoviridae sp. cttxo15]
MLQNLSDFAAKTPFELPEVRQNAKQLLAMGVSAENIIPTMKALGDVAS